MENTSEKNTQTNSLWWIAPTLVSVLCTGAWLWFTSTIAGERYEFMIHDELIRLRGPLPPPKDVVVVALDESTYQAWELPMDRPIPRERYAKLITRLAELGAKRVVFDVVFAGPGAVPEWDQELAESLKKIPVVLGMDHGMYETNGTINHEIIKPNPDFASNAYSLGLVGLEITSGVARNFYVERDPNLLSYVTLSEAANGITNYSDIADNRLPHSHDLINFFGPARSVPTLSMYQVLEDIQFVPKEYIKDKIVFVGLALRTGLGAEQKDRFLTPFGDIFGVEIHATEAANLAEGNWIRRPSPQTERIIGSTLTFLSCFLIMIVKPVRAGIFTLLAATLWLAGSYAALGMERFLTGGSVVLAAIPLAFLINTTYNYLSTRKKQLQIERAFSHYLSPEMVSQLQKNPELLKLGGQEITATALFTDIKGFTTITEQLGALKVTQMLNVYFTDVSHAIQQEGGTVIKFIGDAVFALWGSPVPMKDHAARACRAALQIQKAVDAFNTSGKFPELTTRVGLNTGLMVVGNLGSDKRFDFTAIGDSVNVAARVEGVNKYLGTTVLATDDTIGASEQEFTKIRMGAIKVVGKVKPVNLYALLETPVNPALLAKWECGLKAFVGKNWDEAERIFRELVSAENQLSVASGTYLEAIDDFRAKPPKPDWEGDLIMESK